MNNSSLMTQLRAWLLRPTVVHRLPGRLRLRIPALKRLDADHRELALLWRDLLAYPPQIASVDVNMTSGSALIEYDAASLSESEVLGFLQSANRFVLRYWDRLATTPPDELPNVLERLQRAAQRALRQRPTLDEEIEVPDDVWT